MIDEGIHICTINEHTLPALGVGPTRTAMFTEPLISTMMRYNIITKLRVCHFLAQVLHESGMLKYVKELASGAAYDTGELAKRLGNTPEADGDGQKYKGRGLIQITGHDNYVVLSHVFHENFIGEPERLEQPDWAALSAGWFWSNRHLNIFADRDDVVAVTKRINGGVNGLADRTVLLNKCKEIIA